MRIDFELRDLSMSGELWMMLNPNRQWLCGDNCS